MKISDVPIPNGTYEVVQEGGSLSVPLPVDDADELVAALANPVVTEIEYEPADGYKYKEISGEDGLRWEVIAE